MLFGNDRRALRLFFSETFGKVAAGTPLQPLEAIIAGVIEQHPEYHRWLADPDAIERDWVPEDGETNPFLHMAMHVAIAEQVGADQPPGIQQLHRQLVARHRDRHRAEHAMLECLGVVMWEAQRSARTPDPMAYLNCLQGLVGEVSPSRPQQ
jgi:hypothetical protein